MNLNPNQTLPAVNHFPPERSEDINLLATSLAKAQGTLDLAALNARNDFIGSSYADLQSVVETIREPLAANGLAISQTFLPFALVAKIEGDPPGVILSTTLLHESGQFLRGFLPLLNVTDWHSLGSAISYARRYSLVSMLCVAGGISDDDGEAAMERDQKKRKPRVSAGAKTRPTRRPGGLAEVKKIVASVEGADEYLRNLGVDPGDPPANIREKILALGVDGLLKKLADQKKKEKAKEIIDEADTVEPLEEDPKDEEGKQ